MAGTVLGAGDVAVITVAPWVLAFWAVVERELGGHQPVCGSP